MIQSERPKRYQKHPDIPWGERPPYAAAFERSTLFKDIQRNARLLAHLTNTSPELQIIETLQRLPSSFYEKPIKKQIALLKTLKLFGELKLGEWGLPLLRKKDNAVRSIRRRKQY